MSPVASANSEIMIKHAALQEPSNKISNADKGLDTAKNKPEEDTQGKIRLRYLLD
jgi:hypothetical protein